jgi:hypothetical protein
LISSFQPNWFDNFWSFLQFPINFASWLLCKQEMKQKFTERLLEHEKKSQMCPCQLSTAAGRSVRHILASGEVTGGEEQALHNLQDLLISMVGDVHKKWWWSMAGSEDWRRP